MHFVILQSSIVTLYAMYEGEASFKKPIPRPGNNMLTLSVQVDHLKKPQIHLQSWESRILSRPVWEAMIPFSLIRRLGR